MMKVHRILFILSVLSLYQGAGVGPLSLVLAEPGLRQPPARSEQAADASQQAQALLTLSERQNNENHARALETAGQALTLFQTTGDNAGVARAYALIARFHFAQSDLEEASQKYQTALQMWRELNNTQEQAHVLTSLAFVEARKGEWQKSIAFLSQAEELLAGDDEPTQMGRIASGLGYVFNESGQPEKGLVQYQRALDYYRRTPDARDDALTILEIGSIHYLLGNSAEALADFQQALADVPPDGLDAAQCHHYLGRVYGSLGEYATALQHLQSTLPVYTRAGNLREAADALALIGQIYEQQGRLEPARQNYRQALETFTRVSDRINQAAVYYGLGRLELRARNYGAAEDYLRHSVEVTENIRRVPTSSDLTTAFSATVYERYESYVDCMMREHKAQPSRGLDVRAFEMSELARARSLTELLHATQTNLVTGLDPKLAQREKSLRQTLRVKEDSKVALLGGEYKTEELAALDAELARLEAEYAGVNETIRALYPAYGQITRPTAWDLRSIQEQVIADDQTVLLEFLLGADKSYAWAVTRRSIMSYELPGRARLNEAAQKAYQYLSAPPGAGAGEETARALQELSRMVLSPVAAELKNKSRVIVVADGVLNYIPFQVLTLPSSGQEPAVANYEVVNAPSASLLGELRQEAAQRQPAAKLLAAFGNPVFASNYAQLKDTEDGTEIAALQVADNRPGPRDIEIKGDSFDLSGIGPLFYTKRELSNLLEVAAGGETFMATGFAATRERLLGTDLSQYAILHFATHGLLDPKRPEKSGLLLSTVMPDGRALNGFVGLQSIYELRAPVNLVVLSACRTALGKDVRGEGLLSLTRGFMYAGASSVVASLWKVDDEATAELMREFYTNMLQKGATPAAALRAAQNSIRQKPAWRSPYYWAAFTLQGEYQQVIKPAPSVGRAASYLRLSAGGVLLMLSLSMGWLYRRHKLRANLEGAAIRP
jgi:CHAT domain-containing protein